MIIFGEQWKRGRRVKGRATGPLLTTGHARWSRRRKALHWLRLKFWYEITRPRINKWVLAFTNNTILILKVVESCGVFLRCCSATGKGDSTEYMPKMLMREKRKYTLTCLPFNKPTPWNTETLLDEIIIWIFPYKKVFVLPSHTSYNQFLAGVSYSELESCSQKSKSHSSKLYLKIFSLTVELKQIILIN